MLDESTNSRAFWDRYKRSSFSTYNEKLPERYDTTFLSRVFRVSVMDDFVVEELGRDVASLSVLDVGCATGRLLERVAAARVRSLAGTDLAPRILEAARAKLARSGLEPDLRFADAEDSLPWPAGTFDVVTLTGVIHHFLRPRAALDEIHRVLRDRGRLIMVDACFFPPVRGFFNLCLRVHPHEGDCHFYTPGQARRMISGGGWDVTRCERLNWWSYGLVGVRGPKRGGGGAVARAARARVAAQTRRGHTNPGSRSEPQVTAQAPRDHPKPRATAPSPGSPPQAPHDRRV